MARPQRCRKICAKPRFCSFNAEENSCNSDEKVILSLDEFETIRLVDLKKMTHQECAIQMDISRTTVTEIYESAREKIAIFLVEGKKLEIAGGNYRFCCGHGEPCCERRNNMKIAVTYDNGQVFQHFGHTEYFKIYEIKDGKIENAEVISTEGSGHGALAGFLAEKGICTLICGGIGGGARNALESIGIEIYGGITGDADQRVQEFIERTLEFDPNVQCSHHQGQHNCNHHHDENDCGQHHGSGSCGHGSCH